MDSNRSLRRRAVLASAAGLAVGVAGCSSAESADGGSTPGTTAAENGSTDGETDATGTATTEQGPANYGIDHPALVNAENDMLVGPRPDEAEAGIVMVSDPSCPYCQEWHAANWDDMKSELIDEGKLSYVYRPYPKVKAWATPAASGLHETWDRDEEAFVALHHFYYENHDEMSDGVASATEAFLNENTDVDGSEVKDVMLNYGRQSDVSATKEAMQDADMTTTPSYAILQDGEVTNVASGAQSYSNMKTLLGFD